MYSNKFLISFLFAYLLLFSIAGFTQNISIKLEEADNVKSSNPSKFSKLLSSLEEQKNS